MQTPARKPKKPPQGVRLFPAVMATSAALLGLKAFTMAESLAQTATAAENPPVERAASAPAAAPGANQTPAAASTILCNPTLAQMAGLSQSEVEVLQALGTRRQALDQRATQIETQDDLMTAAERRLDERLAQLHQLETTVNGLLGQLDFGHAFLDLSNFGFGFVFGDYFIYFFLGGHNYYSSWCWRRKGASPTLFISRLLRCPSNEPGRRRSWRRLRGCGRSCLSFSFRRVR